jgi:hypothetical protein
MSNNYIQVLMNPTGSKGYIDDLIANVSNGEIRSSKDLVKKVQGQTRVQAKRMDAITAMSESNMELLEKDLELLDKTLRTYNVVGYIAGTTATLGTILLSIKLKKHYDSRKRRY